jgi:SAGA-associated factor 29
VGSQVAYHLPKAKQSDAEWIQCNVIRITGEYPKIRYEVQDPEPDEHGNMSQTYKANSVNIILIPDDSSGLSPLPSGTMVLARYPETTTFYRAEVIATKVPPFSEKNMLICQRDGTCKLRFEGEEEIGKETDVERRLVLEVV